MRLSMLRTITDPATGKVYPIIAGGSDDDPSGNEPPAQQDDPPAPESADKPLGEAGEKALNEWKQRAKAAEKDAKRAKELEAELQQIREANQTEQEKALAQARKEAAEQTRSELETAYRADKLNHKVEKAAFGKFQDPEDVALYLDLDALDPDDDAAIAQAVDEVLQRKPHLAAQSGKRFDGNADGGARKESGPSQLTRDDLKTMTPEQVNQARQEGRLRDVLAGH